MARLFVAAASSQVGTGSGVTKTLWQYTAPASTGAVIQRTSVSFDGTNPTAAKALVEWVKGATGGTGTALTLQKVSGHTGTVQGTSKENFTVEPTGGVVIAEEQIHTQSGYTMPEEIVLNPGETIALRSNVAAAVNARVRARIEE